MPNDPRPRVIAVLSVSLALVTASAAETPRGTDDPSADPVIAELVEAHNTERAKAGLPPLKVDPKLSRAARLHARDMAEHEKMAHEGSDGSTPAQRAGRQGYRYVKTGENVAYGQPTVASVIRSWMNSPHHKENILGDFSEIGAARVPDEEGRPYWSVSFGTPMPRYDPAEASAELARRIVQVRDAAGLAPLKVAPKLAEAAEAAAKDAARRGTIKDKDKDIGKGKDQDGGGSSPLEEVEKRGYAYSRLSQSLSSGQPTPADVVRGLLEGGNLKQSLLGDFSEVGIGYAIAEGGTPYWCLLFASPPK